MYLVWISKYCIELYDQQKSYVHVQLFYIFNVNFHQEPQQTSQTTFKKLTFSRARYARGFWEVISAFLT